MKAFKTVRDFAAKDVHQADSQKHWKQWAGGRKLGAGADGDGEASKVNEDDNDDVNVKQQQSRETTDDDSKRPRVDDDDDDSVEEEERPRDDDKERAELEALAQAKAKVAKPAYPKQEWEKSLDSLTRKPKWYCPELDATVLAEPPEHPWRGVKTPDGLVYFWNPETNETRW